MSAFKVITEEGKEYQVEASSDQHFTLNGQEKQFDLRELKAGKFHIISGNKSYNLELINENPETKEMTIRVNDKRVVLVPGETMTSMTSRLPHVFLSSWL